MHILNSGKILLHSLSWFENLIIPFFGSSFQMTNLKLDSNSIYKPELNEHIIIILCEWLPLRNLSTRQVQIQVSDELSNSQIPVRSRPAGEQG